MSGRKFRVIQEFKYVPKGVSWSIDKRFKGQQQKDILKIAKIGDIWKYEEVVRNEWPIAELSGRRAYFSDDKNQAYYFQEITEAEDILKHIISDYEFKLLDMTNKWEQGMKCCNSDYLMEDMNGGTICLSKEQYENLKKLIGKDE